MYFTQNNKGTLEWQRKGESIESCLAGQMLRISAHFPKANLRHATTIMSHFVFVVILCYRC
jgi:hypothetical protein